MRNLGIPIVVLFGAVAVWATAQPANVEAHREDAKVAMIDDCDPDDPAWAPVGCLQKRGDVTAAEFGLFLRSPLYANAAGQFLVGHPSWRNNPAHLVVKNGERIRVSNEGGRPHTFTKVAEFGGGRVPAVAGGNAAGPGMRAWPQARPIPSRSPRATNSG